MSMAMIRTVVITFMRSFLIAIAIILKNDDNNDSCNISEINNIPY